MLLIFASVANVVVFMDEAGLPEESMESLKVFSITAV